MDRALGARPEDSSSSQAARAARPAEWSLIEVPLQYVAEHRAVLAGDGSQRRRPDCLPHLPQPSAQIVESGLGAGPVRLPHRRHLTEWSRPGGTAGNLAGDEFAAFTRIEPATRRCAWSTSPTGAPSRPPRGRDPAARFFVRRIRGGRLWWPKECGVAAGSPGHPRVRPADRSPRAGSSAPGGRPRALITRVHRWRPSDAWSSRRPTRPSAAAARRLLTDSQDAGGGWSDRRTKAHQTQKRAPPPPVEGGGGARSKALGALHDALDAFALCDLAVDQKLRDFPPGIQVKLGEDVPNKGFRVV